MSPTTRQVVRIPAAALVIAVALTLTVPAAFAKSDTWVPGKYMN